MQRAQRSQELLLAVCKGKFTIRISEVLFKQFTPKIRLHLIQFGDCFIQLSGQRCISFGSYKIIGARGKTLHDLCTRYGGK